MVFKRFIYFLLILLFWAKPNDVWGIVSTSQIIISDNSTSSGVFLKSYPLNHGKPTYRLVIDGDVNLLGQDSLFRVILIDSRQTEHLVYEAYPLIVGGEGFSSFTGTCKETCVLDSIVPVSLRIEGQKAAFTIRKISFSENLLDLGFRALILGVKNEQIRLNREHETFQINNLNDRIRKKGLKWTAGETSVSKMTYAEKKKLFSRPDGSPVDALPNLQGFEYYKGGIFKIETSEKTNESIQGVSTLRSSWDWKNVHGENWITSVKNQGGFGTCWAHGNMGTLEGVINVYYNRHLNLDLSEQYLVSCDSSGGSIDEACFPYRGDPVSCTNKCGDWNSRFWNSSLWHQVVPTSFDDLKRMIIQKGPIYLHDNHWFNGAHALVIVGFGKDPTTEKDFYIFKNSWGTGWGENGFGKTEVYPDFITGNGFYTHEIPIIPSTQVAPTTSIRCVDNDSDNYCNWGISDSKPAGCPGTCGSEKDCDDSNPNLSTFDADLNCISTQISFNFSVRLGGISTAGVTKALEIRFSSPSFDQVYTTIATSGGGGVFSVSSLSLSGLVPGTYTVYVRDKTTGNFSTNHLRKRMGDITLVNGANSAPSSWSTDSSHFLKPGDTTGDNQVTIEDISMILSEYTDLSIPVTPSNRQDDINGDNVITIYDISLVLETYTDLTIIGD